MKRLTVRGVGESSKVYDAAHTLLGNAVGLVFLTALSFPVSCAQKTVQSLSKPPEIHVSIPDGAEYWVMQPPVLTIEVVDDDDPEPVVMATLNGEPLDPTRPHLINKDDVYFLKVVAQDSRGHVSKRSIVFQVLPVPNYHLKVETLWMDYKVDTQSRKAYVEALLLFSKPQLSPRMRIDPNDPRLQQVSVCRVVPTTWKMVLTDEDGMHVSDPILPSADDVPNGVLCNCLEDVVIVHFRGETPVSVATEPVGFVVLGTALDPNTGDISFFTETPTLRLAHSGGATIKETIRELLNTSTLSPCEPPPCSPPCRCISKASISRTPGRCKD